ncbi:hypothetical protein C8Q79DRAFT_1014742 [Trametes meyenii]|nr:hypothetical protein C8Q79DRAFT_1014742 [Trametes meyenii]
MGSDLNVTVGALLLGVLVTAVGYGITTLQTYMYMNRFPNDPWYIRWTVWSLLILDTTHIMLSWHMTYYYLIINFDNRPALDDSVWSFNITVVVTLALSIIRLVCGSSESPLPLLPLLLQPALTVGHCGAVVTAKIFVLKKLALLPVKIPAEVGTGLGAGTLADCIITGSLVYFLRGHKSGFNQLDSTLDKITYWAVNNGLLTSIVGIIVIVTFSVMPTNMVFLGVHLLLSKLYANSLLATLNFRQAQRGRGLDTDGTSAVNISSMFARTPRTDTAIEFGGLSTIGKQSQGGVTSAPVVHVVTSTTTDADYPLQDMNKGDPYPDHLVADLERNPSGETDRDRSRSP